MSQINKLIIFIFCYSLLVGCSRLTYRRDKAWNANNQIISEYIYEEITQQEQKKNEGEFSLDEKKTAGEQLHLVLALSGEGNKGGAFAYGILEALNSIRSKDNTRSLLQEVDVISAVSGASGPVMDYGLHAEKIFNKDDIRHIFNWNILKWSADNGGGFHFFNDTYGIQSFFTVPFWGGYNISDLTSDYMSKNLFDGATYEDLIKEIKTRGAPFILLSATDLVKGTRFEFSQLQFDLLCSDLSKLEIGRAVTASLIFPIITSGIRLRNFPANHCRDYIISALNKINKDIESNPYLLHKTKDNAEKTTYVHLANGGLIDNLALDSIVAGMKRWGTAWSLKRMIHSKPPKKILIIAANMKARINPNMDFTSKGISIIQQIFPVMSLGASSKSFDSLKLAELELRSNISLLEKTGQLNSKIINFYDSVHVSSGDLSSKGESICLESLKIQIDTLSEDMEDIALFAKRTLFNNTQLKGFIEDNEWKLPPASEWDKKYQGQCKTLDHLE